MAINERLPGSVYIPFVNQSTRNYAVLHIVASEAKVFQTKERAPLLLCLECFRPEAELAIIRDAKKAKKQSKNNLKKGTRLSNKNGGAGTNNNYLPVQEDPFSPEGI